MIGKIINGYKLLRILGEGGMATVYYAENNLGLKAAVKILKEKFSNDPNVSTRFKQEAKIMMKLDDVKGVCRVYDCVEYEGKLVIIMEYLEGMNLRDYVEKKGPIHNYAAIRRMAVQVLQTLSVAHDREIVHRDIKPANLFLVKGGIIKLLDFGISKILFSDDENGTEYETQTRQKMGTLSYMSPEQIKSTATVDARTDIYAFGLTLYNLMTGNDPLDMEEDSWGEIDDPHLVKAIKHAVRKKLECRTPDCQTFLSELQVSDEESKKISEKKQVDEKLKAEVINVVDTLYKSKSKPLACFKFMTKNVPCYVYMDDVLVDTIDGSEGNFVECAPGRHSFRFQEKSGEMRSVFKECTLKPGEVFMQTILFPQLKTATAYSNTTFGSTSSNSRTSDDDGYERPMIVMLIHWAVSIVVSFSLIISLDLSNDTLASILCIGCSLLIGGGVDYVLKLLGIYYRK